jgi:hypothetical protein
MPGAKGHLNEDPNAISGHLTMNPHLRHRLEAEREDRHRREAERQEGKAYFPNGRHRH